jgi:hypothetical protein
MGRYRPVILSRTSELGAAMTSVFATIVTGFNSSNQVSHVASETCTRNSSEQDFHNSCASFTSALRLSRPILSTA